MSAPDYLATFTKAELLAAGAACCLVACEYSDSATVVTAARLATRARAMLTAPDALPPTELKDLGLRLLEAAQ